MKHVKPLLFNGKNWLNTSKTSLGFSRILHRASGRGFKVAPRPLQRIFYPYSCFYILYIFVYTSRFTSRSRSTSRSISTFTSKPISSYIYIYIYSICSNNKYVKLYMIIVEVGFPPQMGAGQDWTTIKLLLGEVSALSPSFELYVWTTWPSAGGNSTLWHEARYIDYIYYT